MEYLQNFNVFDPFWDEMDTYFQLASDSVGFPPDQVKFVVCLLVGYPLAFLLRVFPDTPALKHWYSIVISLFFCRLCLGPWTWFPSFSTSLICYAIVWADSRYGQKEPVAQKVVFVVALLAMIISHLYRQYVDYMGWKLDFTGPQMVLTIKLQSFAFNWADGQRDSKELLPHEKEAAIKEVPSLLEFFGFVYFFPSFLAGPAIEIREYLDYISMDMFQNKDCKGKVPDGSLQAVKSMLFAFVWVPFTILSGTFPITYLASEAFKVAPFYEKLWRIYLHPSLMRGRYYFAWYLSEGAFIACGFGYNGTTSDGTRKWDRAKNMNMIKVELAQNLRDVTSNWNMGTARWLKNYIYLRVTRGQKPSLFSTLTTYIMSAVWHGFYPGYYLMFVVAGIATEAAKDARRLFRPYFVDSQGKPKSTKWIYDVITTVATSYTLNPLGAAFVLLDFRGLEVFQAIYYLNVIIPIVIILAARVVLPLTSTSRRSKPRAQKSD